MESLAAAGFDIRLTGYDPAGLSLGSEDGDATFWGDVETESSEEYKARGLIAPRK